MPIIQQILSSQHLEGALAVIGAWLILKTTDKLLWRFFDEKVFSKMWRRGEQKLKALRTKREGIETDFEFSVDIRPDITVREAKAQLDDMLQAVHRTSNGEFETVEIFEKSDTEVRVEISPAGEKDAYTVDFQFVPDPTASEVLDAPISSLGIRIEFQFAFAELRGAIIDLTSFSNFLKKSIERTYPTTRITDTRFVVAPIDNNLTLDDWIQKQQFDVSLLLRSQENDRRSVRFYGDRAEITTPHENVDDTTVEYIRATLLNYYL